MLEIAVDEVKRRLDAGDDLHLLDVREDEEVALCALEGSEHIPMLQLFLGTLRTKAAADAEIVVYCHHGIRSFEAAQLLRSQGYAKARSMSGGIEAWAARFDPTMARY